LFAATLLTATAAIRTSALSKATLMCRLSITNHLMMPPGTGHHLLLGGHDHPRCRSSRLRVVPSRRTLAPHLPSRRLRPRSRLPPGLIKVSVITDKPASVASNEPGIPGQDMLQALAEENDPIVPGGRPCGESSFAKLKPGGIIRMSVLVPGWVCPVGEPEQDDLVVVPRWTT
jgi:hypothetical protein